MASFSNSGPASELLESEVRHIQGNVLRSNVENSSLLSCLRLTTDSLGNTTATSIKTCSSTKAFLLEHEGDYELYSLEHSGTP